MMTRVASALLALTLALPAAAAEYSLELNPENVTIQWTLGDVLHTVRGTFNAKRSTIVFDPQTNQASGKVIVDVASGESGNGARDGRMHANVLESAKYPDAVFVPDRFVGPVAVPGISRAKLHGMFSMHGAAHETTMDVQTQATSDEMNATITFEIPYVAWGMKDPSNFLLKVNKTVQVSIKARGALRKR